ncbi:MAG TPA: hypothetical protein VM534_02070 [Thermoanaerobaculia bacterium]|nr:hypothetical protein [Thermoanaerobaculia bacterium]
MRSLLRRADSPWACLLIVALAWLVVILGRLADYDYRISFFITAGDYFVDSEALESPIVVLEDSYGYDGQFYYRLALDPFTPERREMGVMIDTPAWRHQRIGYPLLVWALSFGQAEAVPFVMVGVNYLAVCLLGWLGGWIAMKLGFHALWGLILPFYPGFHFSLVRNLAEIVEAAFMTMSVALLMARRPLLASAALAYGILVKEISVVLAGSMFLIWIWQSIRRRESPLRWYVPVFPLSVFVLWHLTLKIRWGYFPTQGGTGDLALPFVDFIHFFGWTAQMNTHLQRVWFADLCVIVLVSGLTVAGLFASKIDSWVKLTWLFYFSLAATFSSAIWVDDWGFMRALAEYHVMAALIAIGSPRWIRGPAAFFIIGLWIYTAHGMLNGR